MALELYTKVGDTSVWEFTLKDKDGGVDLSTATAVKVYTRLWNGTANKVDGEAATPDPDQTTNPGKCTFSPSAAGVDTAGVYKVEVEVTWTGGKVSYFPSESYGRLTIAESL